MDAISLSDVAGRVTGAIKEAARRTGAGFEYLFRTATRESSLNPQAKASTSSATGLFQFIDQTWLSTLKEEGPRHGLGDYAKYISKGASGRYEVSNPAYRDDIMRLRFDPAANAVMAGAYTQRNAEYLSESLGRQPNDGELYAAHFLGPAGAARLISAAGETPSAKAATMFPAAADANRSIFFEKSGRARSVSEVMGVLAKNFDTTRQPATLVTPEVRALGFAPAPETRSIGDVGPIFQTLFNTGPRGPLSGTVQALWAGDKRVPPVPLKSEPTHATAEDHKPAVKQAPSQPLDLLGFLKPEVRSSYKTSI